MSIINYKLNLKNFIVYQNVSDSNVYLVKFDCKKRWDIFIKNNRIVQKPSLFIYSFDEIVSSPFLRNNTDIEYTKLYTNPDYYKKIFYKNFDPSSIDISLHIERFNTLKTSLEKIDYIESNNLQDSVDQLIPYSKNYAQLFNQALLENKISEPEVNPKKVETESSDSVLKEKFEKVIVDEQMDKEIISQIFEPQNKPLVVPILNQQWQVLKEKGIVQRNYKPFFKFCLMYFKLIKSDFSPSKPNAFLAEIYFLLPKSIQKRYKKCISDSNLKKYNIK